MKGRFVIAVVSTTLEEVVMAVGVLWGLPKLDIHIPLWILIIMMIAWATYAVVTYQMGSRALKRKPVHGSVALLGNKGKAISPLTPEGMIKVNGELWRAKSTSGNIFTGEEITVVGQDRLTLIVCKNKPGYIDRKK